ncbi:hypothetical protein FGO68_gene4333 [Halteria grandinella]|uniref:Transmembrane protein n=1 Tax=Halteria grandinella TaxID=5974 RepID=A0A8J8SYF3_HALGN|nr:hypothetical protein FGO68_gene4333 [Halteria grandinella]
MFPSVIVSQTEISSVEGSYIVRNLVLVCEPNTTQVITFTTFAIDQTIDDNYIIADKPSPLKNQHIDQNLIALTSNSFSLTIHVQSCQHGDQLLSNGKCQKCNKGTYLYQIQTQPYSCKDCQSQYSECLGGFQVFPLAGYWRSSNISESFYSCLFKEACLGQNNQTDTFMGQCAEGYQGILCADCEQNYSKNTSLYRCSKCPIQSVNILVLASVLLGFVVIIAILVISNKASTKNEKNYLPVFLRILVNHIQILYLTASFDLEWPEELMRFYKSVQPISDAQSQIFSLDCFLNENIISSYFNNQRLIVIKSFIVQTFPIALIILSIASETCIVRFCKNRRPDSTIQVNVEDQIEQVLQDDENDEDQFIQRNQIDETISSTVQHQSLNESEGNNFVSTLIVILFLLHPTITREMFVLFNCKEIDGISRLYVDLEILCYQSEHLFILKWVAAPSLIFYSIGIPTFGLYILMRNFDNLEKQSVKRAYGFLYNGYKKGFSQYWEIIIIYRKQGIPEYT